MSAKTCRFGQCVALVTEHSPYCAVHQPEAIMARVLRIVEKASDDLLLIEPDIDPHELMKIHLQRLRTSLQETV